MSVAVESGVSLSGLRRSKPQDSPSRAESAVIRQPISPALLLRRPTAQVLPPLYPCQSYYYSDCSQKPGEGRRY
jgi:hypothetical protein